MPGCSVKRCGNNSSKRPRDEKGHFVTFHQFPSDLERRRDWVKRLREAGKLNKDGSSWEPNNNAKICSVHFEEEYIDRIDAGHSRPLTMLTLDAVPTKFPLIKEKRTSPRGHPSGPSHNATEQVSTELTIRIHVLKIQDLHKQETKYLLPEQVTVGNNNMQFYQQPSQFILPGPASETTTEVQDILAQAIKRAGIVSENAEDILHANSDLLNLDTVKQEESQQCIETPQISEHNFNMTTLHQQLNETPPKAKHSMEMESLQQEESQQYIKAPQTSQHNMKMVTQQLEDHEQLNGTPQMAELCMEIESLQQEESQQYTEAPQTSEHSEKMAMLPAEDGSNKIIYVQRPGEQVATKMVPGESFQAGSLPAPQVASSSCMTRTQPFQPGGEKDEMMDLSCDFHETLERQQHIQSELLKQNKGPLRKDLEFVTLQVNEIKQVRIPISQEERCCPICTTNGHTSFLEVNRSSYGTTVFMCPGAECPYQLEEEDAAIDHSSEIKHVQLSSTSLAADDRKYFTQFLQEAGFEFYDEDKIPPELEAEYLSGSKAVEVKPTSDDARETQHLNNVVDLDTPAAGILSNSKLDVTVADIGGISQLPADVSISEQRDVSGGQETLQSQKVVKTKRDRKRKSRYVMKGTPTVPTKIKKFIHKPKQAKDESNKLKTATRPKAVAEESVVRKLRLRVLKCGTFPCRGMQNVAQGEQILSFWN